MKLRQLESILSEVDTFDEPSIDLEQIATPAHLAARMIYTAAGIIIIYATMTIDNSYNNHDRII